MTMPSDDAAPVERRPLASRSTAWARAASSFLVRRGASPNGISVAGLAFGCCAGAAFAATRRLPDAERWLLLAAAAAIQLRLLCNLLDGMVAVECGRRSPVGELYNEAPDRLSDAATLIGAGYAAGAEPVWGWAAACVAVWVAYVRALGKTAGAPNDFCGPMAKPHRMALMTAVAAWLAVTPAEWRPPFSLIDAALAVIVVLGLVTSLRRLSRAARFLRRRAA
jgi:phosphatidylglycerophosphate synthase